MKEKMEEMLGNINKEIILLANEVEDSIYRAVKAFETQDEKLARKVRKRDKKVNYREVEIEKQILSFMALQQPVAVDLRFLITSLKMSNDLERMGDHAKDISRVAIDMSSKPIKFSIDPILKMGKISRSMLHDAVQSFINQNTDLAREVLDRGSEAGELVSEISSYIYSELENRKKEFRQAFNIITVSGHLARIADLATNLAEDVIFMQEARIVRYGLNDR